MRALTGKDTDRLPEEQERGISIDLGYAPLDLPDGRRLSLIDVPGHERFVRNMVAGATGIDLFLLVIDAAEGARPQTHEHLAILRLLGIERGVVAVTKADAVDAETLELALEEARELVPDAEVVAVSAKTGPGLDELRAALARAADWLPEQHSSPAPARLYVDRVFTLRGIGTVVTGTLWSGTIGAGDVLRAEPARPRRARPQRPGARPSRSSGPRPASASPSRCPGSSGASCGAATRSSRRAPSRAELPARRRARGARADRRRRAPARPPRDERRPRARRAARRALRPAPARGARGRRARRPRRPPRRDDGRRRHRARSRRRRATPTPTGSSARRAARQTSTRPSSSTASGVTRTSGSTELRDELERGIDAADPLDPGRRRADGALGARRARRLPFERRGSKLYLPGAAPSLGERAAAAAALEAELEAAAPASGQGRGRRARALPRARRAGSSGSATATPSRRRPTTGRGRSSSRSARAAGRIALARFRDLAGCGRRDAQLLLERLDADGVTRRVGDERVLRRAASRSA